MAHDTVTPFPGVERAQQETAKEIVRASDMPDIPERINERIAALYERMHILEALTNILHDIEDGMEDGKIDATRVYSQVAALAEAIRRDISEFSLYEGEIPRIF
ncbi:MAG: hypothetical protein ACYCVB_06640 [Bacilli bacterium]